jgi:GNAT superfamily N-acetyltransferase
VAEPVLRRGTPADDEAIRALLAQNFPDNPKRLAEFTRWQYWDNPFGMTRSWLYEAEGRVVAHWAAVPVPMVLDGADVVGAKGVDGATHSDWRGRGLFRSLGEAMRADCGEHGVPVILSHPNPNAARGVEQAGGQLIARVPVYVLPLDDTWLARRFHLPRPVSVALRRVAFGARGAVIGEQVAGVPSGLRALWEVAGADTVNGIRRDASWWAWRYAARPGGEYRCYAVRASGRLRGAAVVTERDAFGARFLFVLELLAADDEAARGLSAAIAEDAGDAVGAALAALPGTRLAGHAARAGFRRLPRALEPHPFRFMAIDCAGLGDLTKRDWAMAWGDLDHL